MTMKRPYQITAIVWILFSAFVVREAVNLEYYTPLGPGPGFFPFWLGTFIAFLAAIMFYHATWSEPDPMPSDFFASKVGYLKMAAIALAIITWVLLVGVLGYRLMMLAFYLFLLVALGRQNLIATAIVALIGSFGAYHLFVEFLKVPLPMGIFGF